MERSLATARLLLVLRFLTLSGRVRQEIQTTWRIRTAIVNFIFISVSAACVLAQRAHTFTVELLEIFFFRLLSSTSMRALVCL